MSSASAVSNLEVPMFEVPAGQRRGLGELRCTSAEARRTLPLASVSLRARYVNCVPRWLPMTAPGTVARYTTPVGAATSNATPLTVGSMSAEV